jgi:hypothetical protein
MGMSDGSITLYFGLREGEKADLEVVAAAAIKWVETMRAAARVIDPEADFHVGIIDAQESSLKLNTILDWTEEKLAQLDDGAAKHWRLRKLAVALVVFVVISGVPTYDYYFGDEPELQLTQEDRERIDELLEHLGKNSEVVEKKREFYQELERDQAITEVGLSEERDSPPAIKVPRDQFPERGGLWALQEEEERTNYEELSVTLVSPVLLSAKRAWAFEAKGRGEFKATMKDDAFLNALEQDHVQERLRIGIKMKIRLKIEEKKVRGAWVIKHGGRTVVRVIEPKFD